MKKPATSVLPVSREILLEQLAKLEAERSVLLQQVGMPKPRLWMLIADYLRERGGTATVAGIAEALVANGYDLGKYPRRTVTSCLTAPSMISIFKTDGSAERKMVSLRSKSAPFAPPRRGRQQTRAVAVPRG